MKKLFEIPGITVKHFDVIDVITTSDMLDSGEGGTKPVNPFGTGEAITSN